MNKEDGKPEEREKYMKISTVTLPSTMQADEAKGRKAVAMKWHTKYVLFFLPSVRNVILSNETCAA